MEALCSFETSLLTGATRRNIQEGGILQPQGSLPYAQEPSTSPYPEPGQYIAAHSTPSYLKQTPWPLVCRRTIPTELPPLVGEI
jgi:hypothetical protein